MENFALITYERTPFPIFMMALLGSFVITEKPSMISLMDS